jgi:hypothetical protein
MTAWRGNIALFALLATLFQTGRAEETQKIAPEAAFDAGPCLEHQGRRYCVAEKETGIPYQKGVYLYTYEAQDAANRRQVARETLLFKISPRLYTLANWPDDIDIVTFDGRDYFYCAYALMPVTKLYAFSHIYFVLFDNAAGSVVTLDFRTPSHGIRFNAGEKKPPVPWPSGSVARGNFVNLESLVRAHPKRADYLVQRAERLLGGILRFSPAEMKNTRSYIDFQMDGTTGK